MSQCHANATRNPLIISECCNVALIALKIKITCSKWRASITHSDIFHQSPLYLELLAMKLLA